MAGPSFLFLVFLFVSTSFLSFLHATFTFLTTLFSSLTPFSISSSPSSLTYHSHHIIYPPCCRQRVKVLLAIRERKSLLMTHPWRPRKVKRLPISNRIVLRRRKGVTTLVVNALLSSIRGMILTCTSRWYSVTIRLFCWVVLAISRMTRFRHFLGFVGFLHPRSCYLSRRRFTQAHPL